MAFHLRTDRKVPDLQCPSLGKTVRQKWIAFDPPTPLTRHRSELTRSVIIRMIKLTRLCPMLVFFTLKLHRTILSWLAENSYHIQLNTLQRRSVVSNLEKVSMMLNGVKS
ncbi:hypothetical protein CRM22_003840 [Opisthorchis felineus]|uniref:Uncharacterized protein n=1 Tax=Opisthorchis felineus TaxID=147828 RepID=A0A4S2M5D7_OPIFE|nr:hypothetical protein CRM22_003840 [Opisthorchis felineus]